MARWIALGAEKFAAYERTNTEVRPFLELNDINPAELNLLERLWKGDVQTLAISAIGSSGYVLDSLEASVWCLLTTDSYAEAVLKAVNLGSDTDTTGAITGGLAGLLYGYEKIPVEWIGGLARKKDIEQLAQRLESVRF